MSRRALLGATALLGAAARTDARAGTARKPNFVFIMADDLGAFDLSCYGRPDYRTPRIDSLARDGLKFNFGYANSSTCAPTRTALISGRYQNRYQVGSGFGGGYPSQTIGYSGEWPSLPKTLKSAGYRTALIGKWDLGKLPNFSPNKSGYDEFFGLMGGGIDYWTHDEGALSNSERTPDLYENETRVDVEGYATDLFTARACDFIARNASRQFLLSLHYTAPHWPWQTRADRGAPRMNDFHFDGGSPASYAQMVQAMDEGVGRVLDALERHRIARDTLVVFSSDNGGERFSLMWPLRGAKGDLWEGGTRVPLIARWPGRIARATATDQVAMSMDFLPTFAALAGAAVDPSAPPDGIDLSPQLFGAAPVRRTVFWKTPDNMLSALAYPWKYLRLEGRDYLYNLAEDPTEHANLKLRHPEEFARLKGEAEAWSAHMLPTLPGPPAGLFQGLEALEAPAAPTRD
jgi:arylsulfatase A-like enzyme